MSGTPEPVGMGELKYGDNGNILAVYGLGSCIALAVFDPQKNHGVLCHIVLPEAKGQDDCTARYADTAVRRCIGTMVQRGSSPDRLRAKITGGANLFAGQRKIPFMDIGVKNVQAVKKLLAQESIALIGADVGGHKGRTVMFHPTDGRLVIRRTGEEAFLL